MADDEVGRPSPCEVAFVALESALGQDLGRVRDVQVADASVAGGVDMEVLVVTGMQPAGARQSFVRLNVVRQVATVLAGVDRVRHIDLCEHRTACSGATSGASVARYQSASKSSKLASLCSEVKSRS